MKALMFLSNPFTHDPRVYNEAKSLTEGGHEVTVIAWDRAKRHRKIEKTDGINVIRIYNTGFMKLLPRDILRLKHWYKAAYKKSTELYKNYRFNIVHCHDQDTLPIGIMLKNKLGVKLIYDAHEIFGYMVARDLPQWWVNRFLKKERVMAPKADHVITVAEPHEKYFKEMGCKRVTLVRNCKNLDNKEYMPSKSKVFTLLYIGGLNRTRFLIETTEVCNDINGIKFRIAGFGQAESELKRLSEQNPGNIEFIGKIPMQQVITETLKGDVILCLLDPSNMNNKIGPPNKIFEAMVAGRPVIATKGTYSGELVENKRMGVVVEFNKESLKQALLKLRDDPKLVEYFGKNALKAASDEFNWKTQESKLLDVYTRLEQEVMK